MKNNSKKIIKISSLVMWAGAVISSPFIANTFQTTRTEALENYRFNERSSNSNFEGTIKEIDYINPLDGETWVAVISSTTNKIDARVDDIKVGVHNKARYEKGIGSDYTGISQDTVQLIPTLTNLQIEQGIFGEWSRIMPGTNDLSFAWEGVLGYGGGEYMAPIWTYHTSQQSAMEIMIFDISSGELLSQSDYWNKSFRYSPSFKFQLIRSEGNNNPDRKFLNKDKIYSFAEIPVEGLGVPVSHPTTWGEMDLVVDFREPYIHDNFWEGQPKHLEYHDMRRWLSDYDNEYNIEFDLVSNPVNFYTKNIEATKNGSDVEPIIKQVNVAGDYNTKITEAKTIEGLNTKFTLNNGYLRLLVEDVINISEEDFLVEKSDDFGSNITMTFVEQHNGKELRNKYYVNEGSHVIERYNWGEKRSVDPVPFYINGLETEISLWDWYPIFPPIHVGGMISGAIVLITALSAGSYYLIKYIKSRN